MATKRKLVVTQQDDKPVKVEVLAQAIVDLGNASKRLAASSLNRKAVVVLLAHQTGLGQGVVKTVLEGISELEATYLRR